MLNCRALVVIQSEHILTALQSDDLIASVNDMLNCLALVVIQSEPLSFGDSVNCLPRLFADDWEMLPLAVQHGLNIGLLHFQHSLSRCFSWSPFANDLNELAALDSLVKLGCDCFVCGQSNVAPQR